VKVKAISYSFFEILVLGLTLWCIYVWIAPVTP
jgi:uncharacterized protein with PQ loop repeat